MSSIRAVIAAMAPCLAGALLFMTAACTSSVGGSAEVGTSAAAPPGTSSFGSPPTTSVSGPSQSPSSQSASGSSAASTETLTAAGIDPCQVLPDDARSALGITSSTPPDAAAFDGATCLYSTPGSVQYALTVTDGQTLDQLEASVSGRDTTESRIEGFPALTTYDESKPTVCTTAIGVSSTGMFVMSVLDTNAAVADKDQLCAKATSAATTGLKGLRAQQ